MSAEPYEYEDFSKNRNKLRQAFAEIRQMSDKALTDKLEVAIANEMAALFDDVSNMIGRSVAGNDLIAARDWGFIWDSLSWDADDGCEAYD